MFYSERKDPFLRFGDVVRGYVSAPALIKKPISNLGDVQTFCNVNLEVPEFSVVMTPCCSIEDSMLCVTPLIKLRKDFLKNPYFVNDFTIINREITPEHCYPPEDWEKLKPAEREASEAKKKPYTLLNLFIYEKHEILPLYQLRQLQLNYYMIDFRNLHTIKCDLIKRAENMGVDQTAVVDSKCLQLSDMTREELRNKMAYYYGREPEEELTARISVAS